jgi:hypothetical protein
MSEINSNKLTLPGCKTSKQSMIKATSFFSILLVTIGIASSTHAAIASTISIAPVMPNSTLYAQMNNNSMNGRMSKSKMNKMKRSKMNNSMSRSKMRSNMDRGMKQQKSGMNK